MNYKTYDKVGQEVNIGDVVYGLFGYPGSLYFAVVIEPYRNSNFRVKYINNSNPPEVRKETLYNSSDFIILPDDYVARIRLEHPQLFP
jgi:hypothetical protein